MDKSQINDFQAQISIPLTFKDMTKQMCDLTIEAIGDLFDTAEFSIFTNENHSKYGKFQHWSASLVITAEVDGSKTFFLDIDVYFENDSLHKSYRLENLSEELIDIYCGHALITTVLSFGKNLSRCKFNGNQRSF